MKKIIIGILLLLFSFAPVFAQTVPQEEYLKGKIVDVTTEDGATKYSIEIFEGSLKDQTIEYVHNSELSDKDIEYKEGDKVVVSYNEIEGEGPVFMITDYWRVSSLNFLLVLFLVLAIIIAGKKAIYSFAGMLLSFVVIFSLILPGILKGQDPVLIAILGSLLIIPITFYLSHGFNKKTTVAVLGTVVALVVTGLLSYLFVELAHLNGYASEEVMFLGGESFNIKGILLAGFIIGALGVLDDITISQSAIVFELADVNKDMGFLELFLRSMRIGKDHIASMINTLVLVYAGAALPLLLLFVSDNRDALEILNMEMMATEVVRTLVGSIGLILAVPVTTVIAAGLLRKKTV